MTRSVLALSFTLAAAGVMAQATNYPAGSTVDDFTVTDTQGNTHNLYSYTAAGKVVLLDFFFYNCGPCQANAPSYSEVYDTYGCNGGDLICLSVNSGVDNDALAEQFGVDFGGNFHHSPTIGQVDGGMLTSTFGVGAFPTFCMINTDNTMSNNDIWPLTNGAATLVAAFPAGSNIQPMACSVGIAENGSTVSPEIFPIPSSGMLTLKFPASAPAHLTVDVLNVIGQVVTTSDLGTLSYGGSVRDLDLSGLSDGRYLLRLRSGSDRMAVKPIVIAH